jgi:hypothetical protein
MGCMLPLTRFGTSLKTVCLKTNPKEKLRCGRPLQRWLCKLRLELAFQ